jgi:hypothetical protein
MLDKIKAALTLAILLIIAFCGIAGFILFLDSTTLSTGEKIMWFVIVAG